MQDSLFDDHPALSKAATVRKASYALPPVLNTGWKAPTTFPRLDSAKMVAIDLETWDPQLLTHGPGWGRGVGHIVGVAVGTDDGHRWYFPMRHTVGDGNLPPEAVLQWARDEFGRAHQDKVFANAQYDLGWLKHEDVDVAGNIIDVQIAEPLLDEHAKSYSLDTLAQKYLGEGKVDDALYAWCQRAYGGKEGRAQAGNIWRAPPCLVGPYAEGDVDLPLRIWQKQKPLLEEQGLMELFKIEAVLPRILVGMRMKGVRVDVAGAERVKERLAASAAEAVRKCKVIAGVDVDIWAGQSIARALDKCGITYPKTAKGAPSFESQWLDNHPAEITTLIRDARRYSKAGATFIDGYILDKQIGGRVHGQFHQLRGDDGGTVVGRFSSSLPNLENIPARDEEIGPLIRSLWLPEEGHRWTVYDFSQIQFRLMVSLGVGKSAEAARALYNSDPKTDFHDMVQKLIKEETGVHLGRKEVKNCIAAGQLVLTDSGLIPIEKIMLCNRVWDGVEWVTHSGVIYKGYQDVITYDGLTATPDHKVWPEGKLQPVSIGKLASSMEKPRICITENAGKAIRHHDSNRNIRRQGIFARFMHELQNRSLDMADAARAGQGEGLPLLNVRPKADTRGRISTSRFSKLSPALHTPDESRVPQLWRAWHTVGIHLRRIHNVLLEAFSGGQLSYAGAGQDRQQWQLRTGEYTLDNRTGKPTQQAHECQNAFSWKGFSITRGCCGLFDRAISTYRRMEQARSGLCGDGKCKRGTHHELEGSREVQKAHVYDIVNAGPRHRFTVAGKLVANCNFAMAFTGGARTIAQQMGITLDEAKKLVEQYHAGMPFIKDTSAKAASVAAQRGYIFDIVGRRHRFPFWEPRDWKLRGKVKLSMDKEAVEKEVETLGGRGVVRAFSHLSLNRLAQSGEGAQMKKALVDSYNEGLFEILGYPLNIVHDDVNMSDAGTPESAQALDQLQHHMQHCLKWRVPILVSKTSGTNWGNQE